MYLTEITNETLPSQRIKIQYDCNGGFNRCGTEVEVIYKVAKKNFETNDEKHICRSCQLALNNPAKRDEVKAKAAKSIKDKYDGVLPMNRSELINQRKEQFKNEDFKAQWLEKHRQTSIYKYGVDHPMKTEGIQNKQKQSMQDRYGVNHPYQSDEVMTKMKANNLKKHGVENVAALPEVQLKMRQTRLERYGVDYYNQLPEMREYLKANCAEWLQESCDAGGPNKGITRPDEWNQKQSDTVCDLIDKGEWNGGGKTYKGRYDSMKCRRKNPMFRSGYELAVHNFLDNSNEVDFYDYEPFQVPYHDGIGHLRKYIVDFMIHYKDKGFVAVEVKNNYSSPEYLEGPKYQALKTACNEANISVEVWTNEKIKSLGVSVEKLLKSDQVILFQ